MIRRCARTLPFAGTPGATGIALLAALALPGCGRGESKYEVTDVRERPAAGEPPREASPAVRFSAGQSPHGEMGGMPSSPKASWAYTTPEGWDLLPDAPMRDKGWRVAGNPDTECTLSSAGGGLVANVNRWRGQMGLAPSDEASVAALPKKTLLGRPATYVELKGSYKGMRGDKNVADAKMVGLVAELPRTMLFLKMSGPTSVVDAELPHFFALADSIRMTAGPQPTAETPPSPHGGEAAPGEEQAAPFQWTAPEGWAQQPEKAMRLVTYVPAKAPHAEVYVSILGGAAGGTRANVDRWRSQMGLPALSDGEFEALPRGTVLGAKAVYCSMEGSYGGMGGGAGKAGWMLLGMVLERASDTVFVKMTGPADEVRGEQDRFRAFCESFHE